ncbi:hypothetical protein [Leptospira interrogans]|uniref:hypothetical protein n=1 Tax=Leptospira interrogans TaxID=173 RepID=UPI00077359AB|nr:hypothetical protein [Leptospira interrogans]
MFKQLSNEFNKKTGIGIVIGIGAVAASYLGQNFVPESLDTKKKVRPIVIPILVALASALLIKQKEYKPYAIFGAAIMLLFGIIKLLDEEKSSDKKILSKIFGITLAGDRQEIQFNTPEEARAFLAAASQMHGNEYQDVTLLSGGEVESRFESLNGEEEVSGTVEEVSGDDLFGDDLSGDDLFGDSEREYSLAGMA